MFRYTFQRLFMRKKTKKRRTMHGLNPPAVNADDGVVGEINEGMVLGAGMIMGDSDGDGVGVNGGMSTGPGLSTALGSLQGVGGEGVGESGDGEGGSTSAGVSTGAAVCVWAGTSTNAGVGTSTDLGLLQGGGNAVCDGGGGDDLDVGAAASEGGRTGTSTSLDSSQGEGPGQSDDGVSGGGDIVGAGANENEGGGASTSAGTSLGALPEGHAFLSMIYPPTFHLKENRLSQILQSPNQLCIHGLWEVKSLPEKTLFFSRENVNKHQYGRDLLDRIEKLMPRLRFEPEDFLRRETAKHGPNIPFLTTPDEYATFTFDVYEKYHFADLFDYILKKIGDDNIATEEKEYRGVRWTGVEVNDLLSIVHSFPYIAGAELTFELLQRDRTLFLFEVSVCVTMDKSLAKRSKKQKKEVVINKHQDLEVERTSKVYMIGRQIDSESSEPTQVDSESSSQSSSE